MALGGSGRLFRRASVAAISAGLLACATPPPEVTDWHPVALPGKPATQYHADHKDGRPCWRADADRSASLWRRHLRVEARRLGEVEFSWWVPSLIDDAVVGDIDRSDAPARVLFAFGGDSSRLTMRERMMFELAHTLSGEAPPYATLMYVWEGAAPLESVIVNARSARVRKIVVESGPQHLRQWRQYRRNLRDDYRRAFGEEPGPLLGVALMTDSDNTRSKAGAWYGEIVLR